MQEKISKFSIDRRHFLQHSIAVGVAASVYPWAREALAAAGDADKTVVNASHWGLSKPKFRPARSSILITCRPIPTEIPT